MRISAVILSVYILALSVSFCSDACDVEKEECQSEQQDCAGCCSPFSLCDTCVGFVPAAMACAETRLQIVSAEITLYEWRLYADIFLDGIWQPPKFA
jgi:hypothetical protein